MRFGGLELLVIFCIILLFVGPKQIPKLTETIKGSIASFKEGSKEEPKEVDGAKEQGAPAEGQAAQA